MFISTYSEPQSIVKTFSTAFSFQSPPTCFEQCRSKLRPRGSPPRWPTIFGPGKRMDKIWQNVSNVRKCINMWWCSLIFSETFWCGEISLKLLWKSQSWDQQSNFTGLHFLPSSQRIWPGVWQVHGLNAVQAIFCTVPSCWSRSKGILSCCRASSFELPSKNPDWLVISEGQHLLS